MSFRLSGSVNRSSYVIDQFRSGSVRIRLLALGGILALFSTFIIWLSPPALADISLPKVISWGTQCDKLHGVPLQKQLTDLQFPQDQPLTYPGDPLTYQYQNPGEAARGYPELTPDELVTYGRDPNGKPSGSEAHVYANWNKYVADKEANGKKP